MRAEIHITGSVEKLTAILQVVLKELERDPIDYSISVSTRELDPAEFTHIKQESSQ